MSAEVSIVCDVCKKTIYQGPTPIDAAAITDPPFRDAKIGAKTKVRPMRAAPGTGIDHGLVTLSGVARDPEWSRQVCSPECAKTATIEAVDALFVRVTNERHNLDRISVMFEFGSQTDAAFELKESS